MNKKLIDLLTVCRKAGRMVMGFDAAKEAVLDGKASSVLLAEDISPKTEKEIRFFADKGNIPAAKTGCTQNDFYIGIGKKVGVIAVCDDGFSKKALAIISDAPEE